MHCSCSGIGDPSLAKNNLCSFVARGCFAAASAMLHPAAVRHPYYLALPESEQEEIVAEAEDTTAPGELLSVTLEDRSKFTAEEWAEIMKQVEAGEVLLFDTLEEEADYYLALPESERE